MAYDDFAKDVLRTYFEPYFLILMGLSIVVINLISMAFYLQLPKDSSRFGMLFTLLHTQIIYGLLVAGFNIRRPVPEGLRAEITPNLRYSLVFLLTTILSRLVVSISSSFLALDRVFVMCMPMKYSVSKVSLKLSLVATLVNFFVLVGFYGVALGASEADGALGALLMNSAFYLETFVFTTLTIVETILYVVFILRLHFYMKSVNKTLKDDATVSVNRIVLMQMTSHTLLSTIPTTLLTLKFAFKIGPPWVAYLHPYIQMLFAVGVLVTSIFALKRLKPKKAANNKLFVARSVATDVR
ncbi:hypothetical protein L596_007703 [Steinernema carpocapsae]|uniref:G-protein coupled receptors family 1 profile domain-containing protein n=1 Tax=Steinernema carpocapsae TaxID=34508 RepID=A0A4U5PAC0_STECR|nr:hypothetical protein L596_007703 [Steinernema carpocapsae]